MDNNKMNNLFENNRKAWNEALEYHQKARGGSLQSGFATSDYTTFDRDCDKLLIEKINVFGLNGKVIAQLPCNNGRELLSLMRLGATKAVGFDISDTAIAEARQLAEISKLNVSFERVNILEITDIYNGKFDFIYISEGSLQWFPDLNAYFSVITRLLKCGGRFLIYEIHPFAYFFETGFNLKMQNFNSMPSYFDKGPYNYPQGIDYVGGVKYQSSECFWFMHKMSDIVCAIMKNGLAIHEFDEYNMEMANNEAATLTEKFPLSYIIVGEKMNKCDMK